MHKLHTKPEFEEKNHMKTLATTKKQPSTTVSKRNRCQKMLGQDFNDFHLKIQIEAHSCPLNIEKNDIVGNFFDLPVKSQ